MPRTYDRYASNSLQCNYCLQSVSKDRECSSISMEKQLQAAYTKLDQKLIWLPVVFMLLRMWGIIRFFISSACPYSQSKHCCDLVYNPFLVYMQSICDPGQGWSNALFFVVFNHRILHRLCPCLDSCEKWCQARWRRAFPRAQRRIPQRPKVIGHVTVVANEEPGQDRAAREAREGEHERLLANDSLQSNISSSVLYSATVTVGEGRSFNKPRNSSINSKV